MRIIHFRWCQESSKRGNKNNDKFVYKNSVEIKLNQSCQIQMCIIGFTDQTSTAVIRKPWLSKLMLSNETGVISKKQDLTAVECCAFPQDFVFGNPSAFF